MASDNTIWAIILITLVVSAGALTISVNGNEHVSVVSTTSPGGGETSTQCTTGQYAYNETSAGYFLCAQVTFSQLGGSSSCPAGQFAITLASSVVCAAVEFSQLSGIPNIVYNVTQGTKSVTGKVLFANTTTIGVQISGQAVTFDVLSVDWSTVSDFPSGCLAGEFVTAVGLTLTCALPSAGGEVSTQCTTGEYAYNETKAGAFLCAQVQLSELGGSSSCPAGEYAVTISASVTCAQIKWNQVGATPQLVYNLTQGSHTLTGAVTLVNTTSIGVEIVGQNVYFKVLSVAWSSLTGFPSSCSAGQFVTAVGATLTCSSALTSTSTLNYGLVGYWPFDEGSGTSAYDLSGNGNTGTLVNSPTWVTGEFGDALQFASVSAQYVTFPYSSTLVPSAFSFVAWVNFTTSPVNQYIIDARDDPGNYNFIILGQGAAKLEFALINSVGAVVGSIISPSALSTGSYYLIAATFDGTNMYLYENNALVGGPTAGTYSAKSEIAHLGNDHSISFPINGKIDDVRIYNRALSASEILNLYNSRPTYPLITVLPIVSIAKSTVTAGASVWTYTDNDGYNEQMILSTVGAISAETCNGVTGYPIVTGTDCILVPGATMVITWAVTAPVYTKVPFT